MSGPKPKVTAFPQGGFVHVPPILKPEAEEAYGSELPDGFWDAVELAFRHYGHLCDQIDGPRLNVNRKDPRSYYSAKSRTEKSVSKALKEIDAAQRDQQFFQLMTVSAMAATDGPDGGSELRNQINVAQAALARAMTILEDSVAPPEMPVQVADAKQILACRILKALGHYQLNDRLTGRDEATMPEALSEADLQPAERLISALQVHEAGTPSAFARWLRRAVKDQGL